jgi:hypothetical protein
MEALMKTLWLPFAAAMVFAQPSLAASPARSQRTPQHAGQANPSQMPAATTQQGKASEGPKVSEGSLTVKQQLKENLIRSGI